MKDDWIKTEDENFINPEEIEEFSIKPDKKNFKRFVILARLKSGQRRPVKTNIPSIEIATKEVHRLLEEKRQRRKKKRSWIKKCLWRSRAFGTK